MKQIITVSAILCILFSSLGCKKTQLNETFAPNAITIDDVAKEFHFTANVKDEKRILQRYGSIKKWRDYIEFFRNNSSKRAATRKSLRTDDEDDGYRITVYENDFYLGVHNGLGDDEYIYSYVVDELGYNFYQCENAGAGSNCVALLLSGYVDQTSQSFLNDCEMEAGFLLPCVSYAISDCAIKFNMMFEYDDYAIQHSGSGSMNCIDPEELEFQNAVDDAVETSETVGYEVVEIDALTRSKNPKWKILNAQTWSLYSREWGTVKLINTNANIWAWQTLSHGPISFVGTYPRGVNITHTEGEATISFTPNTPNVLYAGMELTYEVTYTSTRSSFLFPPVAKSYTSVAFWDATP